MHSTMKIDLQKIYMEASILKKHGELYNQFVEILKEELLPAMGCTEPIAIAYAGAVARQTLGVMPEWIEVSVSGNIIKNVKSVVVPHTGGMRGIEAAVCAGIRVGDADGMLEVISNVTPEEIPEIKKYMQAVTVEVTHADTPYIFDIGVQVFGEGMSAKVRIVDYHTNVVLIEKNGQKILEKEMTGKTLESLTDRTVMSVEKIVEFANIVDIEDVRAVLDRQISYNMTIAEAGLRENWGANIGKVILNTYGNDIKFRAKAKAAAGSDARMNGCELPVVINSGSGNQGITASVPVIEYARELGVTDEKMYRALVVSNLVTIHLKTGVGRLSAYCGAISAGCGSGTGIAYLKGGDFKVLAHTLVNSLAIVSGIICDGAKASCAAKIAAAVDAGILGYEMYMQGQQFYGGDGIVTRGVENTISNVGRLARDGMSETDKEIIRIMVG